MNDHVLQGTFVSVSLAYGNHFDEVVTEFLRNGWAIHSHDPFKTNTSKNSYLTFIAGVDAKEVKLNTPNAHIL